MSKRLLTGAAALALAAMTSATALTGVLLLAGGSAISAYLWFAILWLGLTGIGLAAVVFAVKAVSLVVSALPSGRPLRIQWQPTFPAAPQPA